MSEKISLDSSDKKQYEQDNLSIRITSIPASLL